MSVIATCKLMVKGGPGLVERLLQEQCDEETFTDDFNLEDLVRDEGHATLQLSYRDFDIRSTIIHLSKQYPDLAFFVIWDNQHEGSGRMSVLDGMVASLQMPLPELERVALFNVLDWLPEDPEATGAEVEPGVYRCMICNNVWSTHLGPEYIAHRRCPNGCKLGDTFGRKAGGG